ncbi:MAG TPA: glycoside hydrolase family 20 zincin-like fold domain-containing protein [Acidobacteriaceae bacterium]|nr:glycoside hydrolase family 20 zincin-like fold domain-containing protein [Acidobacteriaceae bacterium]
MKMQTGFRLSAALAGIASFLTLSGFAQSQHSPLLPAPVKVQYGAGYLDLADVCIASITNSAPEDTYALTALIDGARGAVSTCAEQQKNSIQLKRSGPVAPLPVPGETPGPNSREAYTIEISADGVVVTGHSSAGEYYGVQTLLQMIEHGPDGSLRLPYAQVEDWPALAYRGTLMDAGSEGPMLTFEEVKRQIDFIAKWKGNQYFFYSEGNIELHGYPLLNPQARFTQQQIRDLVAYARERHIDVIPAVEMYGHLHDLFRIETYSGLSDFPHGGQFDASNPRVKAVLADWAAQIGALFPSQFVDVGFDETWSLEQAADQTANSTPVQLFIQQLTTVTNLFQAQGKTVMAYADIMVKFPGIVQRLPKGVIALPWAYEAKPDPEYHHWLDPLIAENIPNIVLSGVMSWDEIAPDFTVTFDNIDTLLVAGRRSHSLGLMNTLWTDNDQMLMQMSWPGIAYGAAAAWQQTPMQQKMFFTDYARIQYPATIAADFAAALTSLNSAERDLHAAVGEETTREFWRDPFTATSLHALEGKYDDLHRSRLEAEDALTHFYAIQQAAPQTPQLDTFLFGAQAVDLAGMKFIYAGEIARAWQSLPSKPTRKQFDDAVGKGFSNETHSRMMDMMDGLTGTRALYQKAWLEQYTPYRLGTALGHWDAEFLFWQRAQRNFEDFRRGFQSSQQLPSLHDLLITPQ